MKKHESNLAAIKAMNDDEWINDLLDAGLADHARTLKRIMTDQSVTEIQTDDLFHLMKNASKQREH